MQRESPHITKVYSGLILIFMTFLTFDSLIYSRSAFNYLLDKGGHRVPEQEGGLTNYTKRSDTVKVARATPLTTLIFGQITEFGFFEKINFFEFGGPKKLF